MELFTQNDLYNLISRNDKDFNMYLTLSYNTILVRILEVLVNYIEKDISNKRKIKSRLLAGTNKIRTIKNLVYEHTKCNISSSEAKIVYSYLLAYFRKLNIREQYEEEVRIDLLQKQNSKCDICKRVINLSNSELDHIIPWSLVGDELGIKNLQLLCQNCNRKKSNNIAYSLNNYLINN